MSGSKTPHARVTRSAPASRTVSTTGIDVEPTVAVASREGRGGTGEPGFTTRGPLTSFSRSAGNGWAWFAGWKARGRNGGRSSVG
jgi:hypothetical protein